MMIMIVDHEIGCDCQSKQPYWHIPVRMTKPFDNQKDDHGRDQNDQIDTNNWNYIFNLFTMLVILMTSIIIMIIQRSYKGFEKQGPCKIFPSWTLACMLAESSYSAIFVPTSKQSAVLIIRPRWSNLTRMIRSRSSPLDQRSWCLRIWSYLHDDSQRALVTDLLTLFTAGICITVISHSG